MQSAIDVYMRNATLLLLGFATLLFTACSQTDAPLEAQIEQYIASAETAAKERNPLALRALVAENYLDGHGRNQREVVSLAAGYLLRNRNIHTLTRIRHLAFPQPDEAELALLVGLAGEPVDDLETLISLQASIYLFELKLVKTDDNWLLERASWKRASGEDIF